MPTLCFTCPNTHQKVSTGAASPTLSAGLETAKRESGFLQCDGCGENHLWETLVVYIEDDADADRLGGPGRE